jgi:ElaB/YqjD/DUF883 family membrane-anchored ribosome-binding protein
VGQRADELEQDRDLAESTAAAREDIELTRAEMTSTIDAIQDKLDPEVLSEQAKDTAHDVTDHAIREAKEAAREIADHALAQAREAVVDITGQARAALREATIGKVETMAHIASERAGGWRQTLVETVKANPLPAAVVGLGLGWMFLNRPGKAETGSYGSTAGPRRYVPPAYGAGVYGGGGFEPVSSERPGVGGLAENGQQTVGRAAEKAQQTASQVAGQVQGTAEHVVDQVQETGGQVVDQVQAQASRAQSFLHHQLEENPLLVGAVALALGGVLASTVPMTPREDELMGDARDRVMGTARELTQETMDRVGRVVDEVQSAAKTEAQKQSLVP